MSETDEGVLLSRVRHGDRSAFEAFYQCTAPWLEARLRRRCHDRQIVAEVVQETYLSVWRGADTFAEISARDKALGWLWRIATRRLVDVFRREGRQQNVLRAVAERAEPDQPQTRDVAATVLEHTFSPALGAALAELAPELRQVLWATVLAGLSVREASILLGVPEGTVKTRARRARLAIRAALS